MGGHSHWAGIKHKKAITDAKKGKVYTKLIREITIAAKLGGGDLASNARLRKAADDAKAVNMALDEFKTLDTEPLIASEPAHPRDSSRLLVLERATGAIHHKIFREIGEFLKAGDLIVINDSKVFPARLLGNKPSGGKSEILLVRQDAEPSLWYGLARDCRCGNTVLFEGGLKAEAISRNEQGELLFRFSGGDALSYAMREQKLR